MKTMHRLTVLPLAVLLAIGAAGCGRQSKSSTEGHWTGFDVTKPGVRCEVTIQGTNLDYRGAQPNDYCRGTFVLNENVKPAQMDLMVADSSDPKIIGKTMLLIREVDGNTMKVAGAAPGSPQRPVDFTPNQQVQVFSFTHD